MATAEVAAAHAAAVVAERMLDAVHAALLAGRLGDLPPLASAMAEALDGIAALDDAPLALRLQRKAARNEACLRAAARGVRTAMRRMRDLAAMAQGPQTYDGQGRRAALDAATGRLARRV